jgi:hypothetical protein
MWSGPACAGVRSPRTRGASIDYRIAAKNLNFRPRARSFHLPSHVTKSLHGSEDDDAPEDQYEGVVCEACSRLHFVNPKTGQLMGEENEWIKLVAWHMIEITRGTKARRIKLT